MIFTISQAKQILLRHGFRPYLWAGSYTICRLIPEYGSRSAPFHFHRDHRGFQATHATVAHIRRLAEALHLADSAAVTAKACGAAVLADRKAAAIWQQCGEQWRDARLGCRRDDAAVAELKAAGAAHMLKLVADVMKEGWQQFHPIKPYTPSTTIYTTTTTTRATA